MALLVRETEPGGLTGYGVGECECEFRENNALFGGRVRVRLRMNVTVKVRVGVKVRVRFRFRFRVRVRVRVKVNRAHICHM